MSKKNNNCILSSMYCIKCGNKGIEIPRIKGHFREPGHLKELYCVFCKEKYNHVEIRPFFSDYTLKDFQKEREYGNFDENGKRKQPYRIFRGELKQKGLY